MFIAIIIEAYFEPFVIARHGRPATIQSFVIWISPGPSRDVFSNKQQLRPLIRAGVTVHTPDWADRQIKCFHWTHAAAKTADPRVCEHADPGEDPDGLTRHPAIIRLYNPPV